MARYMFTGNYTTQGIQGLLADSAAARQAEVTKLIEAAGGKLESMHFAFGSDDFVIISEFPDNTGVAAVAMVAAASGAVNGHTTVLLTASEMDDALATSRRVAEGFRPPGK